MACAWIPCTRPRLSRPQLSKFLQLGSDWILAAVFLVAAVPKIADPETFADAIASYRMTPSWIIGPAACFLPWFEGLCALLLVVGRLKTVSRTSLLGLLGVYTLLTLVAIARGIDIHCGCFGGEGGSAWTVVLRNLAILGVLEILHLAASRCGWRERPGPRQQKRARSSAPMVLAALLPLVSAISVSEAASAATTATQPTSRPAARDLKPGKTLIRRYDALLDWRYRPMTYHVNLPSDFRADRKYPILLEWHGKGAGPGTKVFPRVYRVTGHIHVGLTYPRGCRRGTAMLYATKEYVKFIRHVYDDVVENFNGHPDYVFIGGYSAGGFMAAGPGISLMIRAKIRDKLAGVLAGGCSWMCDHRYANGVNIIMWYSDNDSNSYELPHHVPKLRKYARRLIVLFHKGAGHRCDNAFEGPHIRRFLALNGPDRRDFLRLYRARKRLDSGDWRESIETCGQIAGKHNTASPMALRLLDRSVDQIKHHIEAVTKIREPCSAATAIEGLLRRHRGVPKVARLLRRAAQSQRRLCRTAKPDLEPRRPAKEDAAAGGATDCRSAAGGTP